jgi:superfamily II DNA or RNA helicase
MIKLISKKTLIIVPNTYLLNQWVELLEKLFPDNTIGQYYTKKKIYGDIIVMIINSACNNDEFSFKIEKGLYYNIKSNILFKKFGLVIYDECHMYCSKKFKHIFNKVNVENLLGLSATPDEKVNGFDKLIKFHLGDIIIADDIEQYEKSNENFISNIHTIKYSSPDEYANIHLNKYTKLVNTIKILEEITSDPYRNQLIVNKVIEFYNEKRNVYVFSDRRQHLELLYKKFVDIMLKVNKNILNDVSIPEIDGGVKSSILYGGSKMRDIDIAKNHSKIIFTTYQYSSTGVSIVKMDTLILTTPRRSNMKQIIGRIFRLGSDMEKSRIIVDILDTKSVLKGQYGERKKAYFHRDSEFNIVEVDYTDIELV